MRFTFNQAVKFFHERCMWAAQRYTPPNTSVEATDIYQELLIALTDHEFPTLDEPIFCKHRKRLVKYDPSWVNGFIDSRAKDILRKELYRQRVKKISYETLARQVVRDNLALRADINAILEDMPKQRRDCLMLLIMPDNRVMQLAVEDQKEAMKESKTGRLRMNVHKPKVTLDHVAKVLHLSKATVSREVKAARKDFEALAD